MSDDQQRPPRLCYACGDANDRGLHMQFTREGEKTICEYDPAPFTQGYPGRVHGGVVSSLLDEAMGWAVYHAKEWGATARLNIRYRKPVPLGERLRVSAWITRNRGRLMELKGEIHAPDGDLLAEADGTFMKLDQRFANEMSTMARRVGFDDAPEVVT